MSNYKYKKNENGYSLIEIMIAIMIIGISFISLISVFPFALKIVKSAEDRTRASYYAQEEIEELYQTGYDGILTGTVETRAPLGTTPPRSEFERETIVTYIDDSLADSVSPTGLKKITCRVYYTNPLSKNDHYFETATIIAEN